MDLAVAWYQEEQEGEAKRIWSNIWETAEMVSREKCAKGVIGYIWGVSGGYVFKINAIRTRNF